MGCKPVKKGALADPLPFVFLLLGASVMGLQTLGVNNAMSQEVVESVEDLERVAQSKQSHDLYLHEYLSQAGEHSIHETARVLGGEEQGGVGSWSWNDDLGQPRYIELYQIFNSRSQAYLNENYPLSAATQECNIDETEYTMTMWSDPNPDVKYAVSNSDPQSVNCNFGGESVRYQGSEARFQTEGNATDNTYLQMAHTAAFAFQQVKQNLTAVQESYEATSDKVCESKFNNPEVNRELHRQAQDKASEKVSTAISSEKDEAMTPFPKDKFPSLSDPPFFEARSSATLWHSRPGSGNPGAEYFTENYVLRDNNPQEHEEIETEEICPGTCGCPEECQKTRKRTYFCNPGYSKGECADGGTYTVEEEYCSCEQVCEKKWYVKETIYPKGTIFEWRLTEERYQIPTIEGWRPLNFTLLYGHNYIKDAPPGTYE